MKELRTYLLLALAAILAAVAILKLTRGEPLTIPVRVVEVNTTQTTAATPVTQPEQDVKDKDPLGLFAKTTFTIQNPGRFKWVLFEGKRYPIENGRVTLPGRHTEPLTLTLFETKKLCPIPKAAAVERNGTWYVRDEAGEEVALQVERSGEKILFATPPCPAKITLP